MATPVVTVLMAQMIGTEKRVFVEPGRVAIGNPNNPSVISVTWKNLTYKNVKLWFPNGDQVFDVPPGAPPNYFAIPIDIPAGGAKTLHVKAGANQPAIGDYHYHLYCEEIHDCAEGHSEPWVTVP